MINYNDMLEEQGFEEVILTPNYLRHHLETYIENHKSSFVPYKQVSVRNGDHEWLRMTNAFILCDLVWKVQKSHTANREGSFKMFNFFLTTYL